MTQYVVSQTDSRGPNIQTWGVIRPCLPPLPPPYRKSLGGEGNISTLGSIEALWDTGIPFIFFLPASNAILISENGSPRRASCKLPSAHFS